MSPAAGPSSHIWFLCNSKISNWSSSGTAAGRPIVRLVVKTASRTDYANLRVQRNKCWRILKQWHKANFRRIGSLRLRVSTNLIHIYRFSSFSPCIFYLIAIEPSMSHETIKCKKERPIVLGGFEFTWVPIMALPEIETIESQYHHWDRKLRSKNILFRSFTSMLDHK